MAVALDSWLYDSVDEAHEDAITQLQNVWRSRSTGRLISSPEAEQEYIGQIETGVDSVVEAYTKRVIQIFEIKPDAHTIAIIALEAGKVQAAVRDTLLEYKGSRDGKLLMEEIIRKTGDDLGNINSILLQKLSRSGEPGTVVEDGIPKGVSSAKWTGKRSPRELAVVVRQIGPSVLEGLGFLIAAVEQKRFNDEDAQKALEEARMLHTALGELLDRADAGERMGSLLDRFEHLRICALNVLSNRWTFFAASPVLTMGTVSALHGMSAQPFDGGAIATIWGGWVAAKLVAERR